MVEAINNQITIYVDGEAIQTEQGAMLLNAIDAAGLGERVPRMCHHKELFPAGNCRVCVVEIDGIPNTVPSCHTPVTEGMKVFTSTEKVVAARQAVIEFMLINHPLDCLVCDQGGDCELQDMVYQFGADHSRYQERKVDKKPEDISPFIAVNANRCIKCMRCVRFLEEVSGQRELGMLNRGEDCKISSFFDENVVSKLSGNVIDICPVGALLPKSATHKVRAWELERTESVSPYDALGTNIYINSFDNKVIKITPRENSEINGSWISDQDRFGFLDLQDRVEQPVVKGEVTPWEQVQQDLGDIFADTEKSTLFMVAPTATVEQMLAVENLAAAMPNAVIDYCLPQLESSYLPVLGMDIKQLQQADLVIVAGGSLDNDLPVLGARLRKDSVPVVMVDPENPDAGLLQGVENPVLLFGKGLLDNGSVQEKNASELRDNLQQVFAHPNLKVGDISGAANSVAAAILQSLRSNQNEAKSFNNVVLIGGINDGIAAEKLDLIKSAKNVIAMLPTHDAQAELFSNVILPIPAWTEVAGSFVNMALDWQCFKAAVKAPDTTREIEQICAMIAKAAKVFITRKITEDKFAQELEKVRLKQVETEQSRDGSAQ